MKKIVTALVLAVVCAAMGGVLWQRRHAATLPAAQLAPPESLLLAEFPDLPATASHWQQTALFEILQEPEVQAFLAPSAAAIFSGTSWAETRQNLANIRPRQAFLAVASLTNNMPHAVAGFTFEGDRQTLEPLIAKALIRAQNASPQGQLKRLHYRRFQIAAFSDRGITLAGCFAGNWYFVANDVELLQATLDRFSGKTHSTLATLAAYRQSERALPTRPDFRLFVQPNVISNKLLARLAPPDAAAEQPSEGKIEAAALATRLEGRQLHDTLFLYQPAASARPLLNGKTLDLTTPGTLFYGAMAPHLAAGPSHNDHRAFPQTVSLPTLLAALNPKTAGDDFAQFKTAFGPEHALLMDWPEGTAQPHLFLACEIRDPAQARHFMESVFRAWSRADADGISTWTLTLNDPPFHPAVALTGRHLLAGLSSESLKPFASHAVQAPGDGSETLERSPAFQSAMATVFKPQTGLAYLDAPALFDRLYGLLRPAALLWGPTTAPLNRFADFTRTPTASVISRHLSPICLAARQTETGLLMESTGPVTFLEVSAALGTGVFYAALPALRENIPALPKKGLPLIPPNPAKPLSAPEPSAPPAPEP